MGTATGKAEWAKGRGSALRLLCSLLAAGCARRIRSHWVIPDTLMWMLVRALGVLATPSISPNGHRLQKFEQQIPKTLLASLMVGLTPSSNWESEVEDRPVS